MNKFNYLIYLDNGTIQSMLKYDNNKAGAHIWHVSFDTDTCKCF